MLVSNHTNLQTLFHFQLKFNRMTFPRNSLRAFLSHAKKSLAKSIQQSTRVTIVIGNESCGLHMSSEHTVVRC